MSRSNPTRRPLARAALWALVLGTVTGCTLSRIVRYRDPDATDMSMFAKRTMRPAEVPYRFARAPEMRSDLDTVRVRDPATGRLVTFGEYQAAARVLAFLVIHNDTIVYERYAPGFDSATVSNAFSVSKSATSALVGIALARGEIRSLDDSVARYVPELRGRAYGPVTIRQLLDMRSGVRWREDEGSVLQRASSDEARVYYTTDLHGLLRDLPREEPAGTRWRYKDTDAEVLGWVLERATGKPVATYMEEVLWRPMGAEHEGSWNLDRAGGHEKTSTGWNATARDFAKLGRLYLNGGSWNGRQVVPAEWVAASTTFDSTRRAPEVATWFGMQHTNLWWQPMLPPHGDFFADGSLGQRIYVQPRTRTIIVQLANSNQQDFPFRRIAAVAAGERWDYPRPIPNLLLQALGAGGIDSARAVYRSALEEMALHPERYSISPQGMRAVAERIAEQGRAADAQEVLRWCRERFAGAAPCQTPLAPARPQR
ncbi:MAG TPA: serine hydrolase [Longimicrobiaceae bacterium]|nr:serine hydrolase [Longimicrobiaceae bacterium]